MIPSRAFFTIAVLVLTTGGSPFGPGRQSRTAQAQLAIGFDDHRTGLVELGGNLRELRFTAINQGRPDSLAWNPLGDCLAMAVSAAPGSGIFVRLWESETGVERALLRDTRT